MLDDTQRSEILIKFGAKGQEIHELLAYNTNRFNVDDGLSKYINLFDGNNVVDEPVASAWEYYVQQAQEIGAFNVLKKYFVQFNFPIQRGINESQQYKDATLRGIIPKQNSDSGLMLKSPKRLSIYMRRSMGGRIPILYTSEREDFITLVRVFAMKNQPIKIPDSMGACMVKGYNNWDRIEKYKAKWLQTHCQAEWGGQLQYLSKNEKELYQDTFIILSNNPYSAVEAKYLNLSEEKWKELSLIIRAQHESAHYFVNRFFGAAKNNAIDEIIADYMGIKTALGYFDPEWFLRFVGLEGYPEYRQGGRLENYKGTPPISEGAFKVLQKLVWHATYNIKNIDCEKLGKYKHIKDKDVRVLSALCSMTLEEMATM